MKGVFDMANTDANETQKIARLKKPDFNLITDYFGTEFVTFLLIIILIWTGWLLIYWVISIDIDQVKNAAVAGENEQGLSPAIKACYRYHTRTGPMIIAVAVGFSFAVAYVFGNFLYRTYRETSRPEGDAFWRAVAENITGMRKSAQEHIPEYREYIKVPLDRRNLFWSLFIRLILAILVVSLISLLISTCKIESQAGLPIISGIIGFIIGQGADFGHSVPSTLYVRGAPEEKQESGGSGQSRTSSEAADPNNTR